MGNFLYFSGGGHFEHLEVGHFEQSLKKKFGAKSGKKIGQKQVVFTLKDIGSSINFAFFFTCYT